MDWLETNHRQESFFLWVDMWDPHEPFDCPWCDYDLYANPDYAGDHGASEARIRPFLDANVNVQTPAGGTLYAFRDDQGQWIAFPTEREALQSAYRDNAPGPRRRVEEITFGALLEDNPKNLVRLYGQYYWAQDLAS